VDIAEPFWVLVSFGCRFAIVMIPQVLASTSMDNRLADV
jgi:hypothetical protein